MEVELKLMPYDEATMQIMSVETEIPEGVKMIKAPEVWAQGYTGKNVKIAIIDSGCDINHPDLKDNIIGGRNFTAEDNGDPDKYNDYHGHGTHVAGTIAAKNDGQGVVGVAPDTKLLILKVLTANGSGNYDSLIQAINYAVTQQVDIISMSLGGPQEVPQLYQAITQAVNAGICVVCAAANSGDGNATTNEIAYPAYYNEVISVGAAQDTRSSAVFSNSNNQVDLMAPGVNILSTAPNNGYVSMSGTSMAAPHAAGALALLVEWGYRAFGRKLTELELYSQLIRRSVSIGLPKTIEGNGMLYLTAQDELEALLRNKPN